MNSNGKESEQKRDFAKVDGEQAVYLNSMVWADEGEKVILSRAAAKDAAAAAASGDDAGAVVAPTGSAAEPTTTATKREISRFSLRNAFTFLRTVAGALVIVLLAFLFFPSVRDLIAPAVPIQMGRFPITTPWFIDISGAVLKVEMDSSSATEVEMDLFLRGTVPSKHNCDVSARTCRAARAGFKCDLDVLVRANLTTVVVVGNPNDRGLCVLTLHVPAAAAAGTLGKLTVRGYEDALMVARASGGGPSLASYNSTGVRLKASNVTVSGFISVDLRGLSAAALDVRLDQGGFFVAHDLDVKTATVITPSRPIIISSPLAYTVTLLDEPPTASASSVAREGQVCYQAAGSVPTANVTAALAVNGTVPATRTVQLFPAAATSSTPAPTRTLLLSTNGTQQISVAVLPSADASLMAPTPGAEQHVFGPLVATPTLLPADVKLYQAAVTAVKPAPDIVAVTIMGSGAVSGTLLLARNRIFMQVNAGLLKTLSAGLLNVKTVNLTLTLNPGFCPQSTVAADGVAFVQGVTVAGINYGRMALQQQKRFSASAATASAQPTSAPQSVAPAFVENWVAAPGESAQLPRLLEQLRVLRNLVDVEKYGLANLGFVSSCGELALLEVSNGEVSTRSLLWTEEPQLRSVVALSLTMSLVVGAGVTLALIKVLRGVLKTRRDFLRARLENLSQDGVVAVQDEIGRSAGFFAFFPKVTIDNAYVIHVTPVEQGPASGPPDASGPSSSSSGQEPRQPYLNSREVEAGLRHFTYLSDAQLLALRAEAQKKVSDEYICDPTDPNDVARYAKSQRVYFIDTWDSERLRDPDIYVFHSSVKARLGNPKAYLDVLRALQTQEFAVLPVSAADKANLRTLWFEAIQLFSAKKQSTASAEEDASRAKTLALAAASAPAVCTLPIDLQIFVDDYMDLVGLVGEFVDAMFDSLERILASRTLLTGGSGRAEEHEIRRRREAEEAEKKRKRLEEEKRALRYKRLKPEQVEKEEAKRLKAEQEKADKLQKQADKKRARAEKGGSAASRAWGALRRFIQQVVWVAMHILVLGAPTWVLHAGAVGLRRNIVQDGSSCSYARYEVGARAFSAFAGIYLATAVVQLMLHNTASSKGYQRAFRYLFRSIFHTFLGLASFMTFAVLTFVLCWMILGLFVRPQDTSAYLVGIGTVGFVIVTQATRAASILRGVEEQMASEMSRRLRELQVVLSSEEKSSFVRATMRSLGLTSVNIAVAILALLIVMCSVLSFVFLGMSAFSRSDTTLQAVLGSVLSGVAGLCAVAAGRQSEETRERTDRKAVLMIAASLTAALFTLLSKLNKASQKQVDEVLGRVSEAAQVAEREKDEVLQRLSADENRARQTPRNAYLRDATARAVEEAKQLIAQCEEVGRDGRTTALEETLTNKARQGSRDAYRARNTFVTAEIRRAEFAAQERVRKMASRRQEDFMMDVMREWENERDSTGIEDAGAAVTSRFMRLRPAGLDVIQRDLGYDLKAEELLLSLPYIQQAEDAAALSDPVGYIYRAVHSDVKRDVYTDPYHTMMSVLRSFAGDVRLDKSGADLETHLNDMSESASTLLRLVVEDPDFVENAVATAQARATDLMRYCHDSPQGLSRQLYGCVSASSTGAGGGAGGGGGGGGASTASSKPTLPLEYRARYSHERLQYRMQSECSSVVQMWVQSMADDGSIKNSVEEREALNKAAKENKTPLTKEQETHLKGLARAEAARRDVIDFAKLLYSTIEGWTKRPGARTLAAHVLGLSVPLEDLLLGDELRAKLDTMLSYQMWSEPLCETSELAASRTESVYSKSPAEQQAYVAKAMEAARVDALAAKKKGAVAKFVGDLEALLRALFKGVLKRANFIDYLYYVHVRLNEFTLWTDYHQEHRRLRAELLARVRTEGAQANARKRFELYKSVCAEALEDAQDGVAVFLALRDSESGGGMGDVAMYRYQSEAQCEYQFLRDTEAWDPGAPEDTRNLQRREFQERTVKMMLRAYKLDALVRATVTLDLQRELSSAYTSWRVAEAAQVAIALAESRKTLEKIKVDAARSRVEAIYSKLASIYPEIPVYRLRAGHDYRTDVGEVDSRGKTLHGLGKLIWSKLIAQNEYCLVVAYSWNTGTHCICVKGRLPGWVARRLTQLVSSIDTEIKRGRVDELGFIAEPITVHKHEDDLEDEWNLLQEAVENRYSIRVSGNSFSIVGGVFNVGLV